MSNDIPHYSEIAPCSHEQVKDAILNNDIDDLRRFAIAVSMFDPDNRFAEEICTQLAGHKDSTVRGNAVLGLGHIARRFRVLDIRQSKPILESALVDEAEYVRGQAFAAADDVTHFLGWCIIGFADEI